MSYRKSWTWSDIVDLVDLGKKIEGTMMKLILGMGPAPGPEGARALLSKWQVRERAVYVRGICMDS